MSSLIAVFVSSLVLAVLLTPYIARAAVRWRVLDKPSERKVHARPIPRAGGVAIALAFIAALAAAIAVHDAELRPLPLDTRLVTLFGGGLLALALGLWDDVRGVAARAKLGAQIGIALLSYAGGIHIERLLIPGVGELAIGWLSLPLTVFWFLLVLNALNLIDGLDGLASGITVFVALTLLIVWQSPSNLVVAMALAALAGASLGFLRHNFHPASIFLGDSGSYFLGYNLAALSILGSLKSEAAVAIMIPIIALGVPVMDALWAPVRRFILGQRLFMPDRDHIHHRLLKLGYTHRRAVLLLYGITMLMGVLSLCLVHARNDRAALVLVLVGSGVIFGIRWLGYLPFLHRERVVGWLGTVSDELGLRRSRRSFLECQALIASAEGVDQLWAGVAAAAEFLKLDLCELRVEPLPSSPDALLFRHRRERPAAAALHALRISLPILHGEQRLASLSIRHRVSAGLNDRYLLRRVDQLHGSITEKLRRLYRAPAAAAAGAQSASERANILFFTHYFPPEGNAPASRVHALCRHWVRSGQSVRVVTCAPNVPDGKVYDGYRNVLWHAQRVDGIPTLRVWTYLAPNKGTVRRILNFLSYMVSATIAGLLVPRPDIVVATSPQFFCGWAGVLVSWLRGLPFILEIRDIWPESIVTVGALRRDALPVRILERLERRMYAAAAHVVTVGDGYREQLSAKGVPLEKITVISNGVDQEAFRPRPPDPALRERWGLHGRFVCAYVGTIGMASGIDVALRAARLLADRGRHDIHFLLVGDGAERAALEAEAARLGLGNVTFTGRLDRALIPATLASVDVSLVHLKKRELFTTVMPSKIFESAAMARPIVLGVEGHSADLVRRAGCGLCIEPENAAQLVAALERLADDRALGAALGQAGRDYFVSRFDRGALARDYLALIHRLRERPETPEQPAADAVASPAGTAPRPRELTLAAGRDTLLAKPPRVAEHA